MNRKTKHIVSLLMALTVCMQAAVPAIGYALEETGEPLVSTDETGSTADTDAAETESVFEGEGYRVTFTLDATWDGGYCASVRIDNTGEETIENWMLGFDYQGEIENLWNASFLSSESGNYIVKNNEWNQDIPAGGSVSFGFSSNTDFVDFPAEYRMLSKMSKRSEEEYEVAYEVTDAWDSGFTAALTITNVSEATIEDWMLDFDFNADLTSIWDGILLSGDEGHYVIQNAGYDSLIPAGESVTFSIQATYWEDVCEPANFALYSYGLEEESNAGDDMEIVMNAYSKLTIGYAENNDANSVTANLELCTELEGAAITWISDNPDVIAEDGTVTRSGETQIVNLKAVIQYNDCAMDKDFTVRVVKNTYDDYETDYLYDMDSLELLYIYNDDADAVQVYLTDDGYIRDLNGKFSEIIVESPEEALLALYEVKSLMGCEDPKTQLVWDQTSKSEFIYSYKFNQVVDGIPVYGNSIVVSTDLEGNTTSLHSSFIPELTIDTENVISEADAQAAIEDAGYTFVSSEGLTVFPEADTAYLAYNLNCKLDGNRYNLIVDAHTGEILLENLRTKSEVTISRILVQNVPDEFNTPQDIYVTELSALGSTIYSLDDLDKHLRYYDLKGTTDEDPDGTGDAIFNTTNTWSTGEVSAYVSVNKVYDYYKSKLLRNGFDGENGELHININWAHGNSFSDGDILTFGQYKVAAQAGVDTVGHEFTHSVVDDETYLGWRYKDAPGAINEAYADIFGYFAEGDNDPRWEHGEDNHDSPIRVMSDPNSCDMPTGINDTTYYYDFTIFGNNDDHGGVHTNNSVITYPCYQMWNNGIRDKDKLAKLWYTSLLLGYDAFASFDDVRVNVLRAAGAMYMSEHDVEIIKKAFDDAGIMGPEAAVIPGTNVLYGKVVAADIDMIAGNNMPVKDAEIELTRTSSSEVLNTITLEDGTFSFYSLRPGTYTMEISCVGYWDTSMVFTLTSARQINYCDTVELIPQKYMGLGAASGKIKDSVTGAGVDDLTLKIRKGMNQKTGDVYYNTTTADGGKYEVYLDTGLYCVEVVDMRTLPSGETKYIPTYFNIKVLGEITVQNQDATVSKSLNADQLRIVLEWGQTPSDLDSHLVGPTSSGGKFHTWYRSRAYSESGKKIADLDLDDIDSFGPETTTIYNPIKGNYAFYVHNYSGSPSITTSGATVKVYTGNSNAPAYTFSVPVVGNGLYWNVFRYDSKTRRITPVNSISNSPISN